MVKIGWKEFKHPLNPENKCKKKASA